MGDGAEVAIFDWPVLDDFELFFERDAGWTRDVGAVKPELEKKQGLLQDELPRLPTTVPTDSLELVKFGGKVSKKNKSLVEEVEALDNTVDAEKASGKSLKKRC